MIWISPFALIFGSPFSYPSEPEFTLSLLKIGLFFSHGLLKKFIK
jgi:hypothetical protein